MFCYKSSFHICTCNFAFCPFCRKLLCKADTGTPSILFNASATLIAVVLFVSIGNIVSLLYTFILSYSMDNYNKFILTPKLSKKEFIAKATAYKNQNAVVSNMLKIKGNSIFFLQIIFVSDYGLFSYYFGLCINRKRFHITNIFFNRCHTFLLQL